jgi:Pentapeptide repeats (8 copies)
MWKSKKTIFGTLVSLVSLISGGWWFFVEKGLVFAEKGHSFVQKEAEIKKTDAETKKIGSETGIAKGVEIRDDKKHISDLYTNVTSISTVKRQNAVDNLVQYVKEGKEDRLNAITKLAGQIKEESSVTKGVNKKSPENREKTQILLNAIINISAEGEDLRDENNINRIGITSANLYDAALISDVKNKKIKLYLSFNHSIMKESILGGLDLTNVSLVDTNLNGSGLEGTIMSSANLTDSDLTGANLSGADLTHATLTRTNLKNANLTNTDLSNVRGITSKQISETCYWRKATGVVGALRPKSLPSLKKINACNNMWLKK